jgi:prolyl oligopeptidase
VVDVLHGVEVADPYRWLEDGESEEVAAWVAAQNERTRTVLDAIPARAALHDRFLELLALPTIGAPVVAGDWVFTLERSGDQEQAVVVRRSAVDRGRPARTVVDPHAEAADHAAAVDFLSPSPDGRLLAYGVSQAGSEHGVLRVVDVETGDLLPDALQPVRHPSVAWLPDASAFAYSRLPDPGSVPDGEEGYWERPYWHALGDDQAADELLVTDELDRTALPVEGISPDGRWLVLHIHLMPTRTDVVLVDRQTGERTVVVEGEEASTWAQVVGDRLYAVTNLDAPRGRVVAAPVTQPRAEHWETIVPEGTAVVEAALVAGDSLLVATTEHAVSHLWRYGLDGSNGEEIPLPEPGSLAGLDADPRIERAFFAFTSFARPPELWRWTPDGGAERWSEAAATAIDPGRYRVEQVFYASTDGTDVPMFVVSPAGSEPSPETPTVLSGYGGFAISSSPAFSPGLVAWCDKGGVFALACIRGGGEYGEDWHRAGMLHHKQQVFDDFAAAADWLVAEGRTSRDRLAIRGGSNGGLLVGATLVQHPDLCRAALCAVPLLDMLRYHRFLIGGLWVPEYGDPDDADDFAALYAYSPYHHLADHVADHVADGVAYPAVLITTAESDSRVDPMHARKFAARLQAATASGDDRPVLLRVETRAGHGVGKPRWKQAEELADMWAFLVWQLGVTAAGRGER